MLQNVAVFGAVLEPFDVRILQIVHELKQDQCAKIYPKYVQARLNASISERQVRRYMVRLAGAGYLERVGKRNGYRPAWVN